MKTFFAVLGILALIAFVLVVGGGYILYRKSTTMMADISQQEINRFIAKQNPPQKTADALKRLGNAMKLRRSISDAGIGSVALTTVRDNVVTDDELKLIDEAATLLEQEKVSREQARAFYAKNRAYIYQQQGMDSRPKPAQQ